MLTRQQRQGNVLITLSDGIMTDALGRTGYIAANYQFQFDKPPQAGAIYTAGFSVCSNGSVALGGSAVWYECLSGGFYNLYNENWAPQCQPITIDIIGASSSLETTTTPVATEASGGQPQGPTIVSSVPQSTNTQSIATSSSSASAVPVTEMSSGQPVGPSTSMTPASGGQSHVSSAGSSAPITSSSASSVLGVSSSQPRSTGSSSAPPVTVASGSQPPITSSSAGNSTVSTKSAASSQSTLSNIAVPLRAGDAMVALAGAAAFALF